MPRIKIIGGNDVSDSKVINLDTGEDITARVRKITWVHEVGYLPTAQIEMLRPELEAVAEGQLRWAERSERTGGG